MHQARWPLYGAWQVGAATAMGQGAGRNVASAAAVLGLLEREAAGGPQMAWVSWDDVDAQAESQALEGPPGQVSKTPVSEPPAAEGRSGAGAGAAAPAGNDYKNSLAGGSRNSGGGRAARYGADTAEVGPHTHAARHGSDRGAAAREATVLLRQSLLRCGRA